LVIGLSSRALELASQTDTEGDTVRVFVAGASGVIGSRLVPQLIERGHEVIGAKPPRHVPVWLARLIAGEAGVMIGTEARGASNAKAKRELGWSLRYPSWRQGFAEGYGKPARAAAARGLRRSDLRQTAPTRSR
jgi:NAD dependent epimerase/dehydratase family